MKMKAGYFTALGAFGLVILGSQGPSAQQAGNASLPAVGLRSTDHPPVPVDPLDVWMTPTKVHMTRTAALNAFISGVKLEDGGSSAKALPILSQPLLRQNPLSEYVQYLQRPRRALARPHRRRPSYLPGAHRGCPGRLSE